MPEYTKLRGVHDVDKKSLLEALEENLKAFFEWGLLEADGYYNVKRQSTPDPSDDCRLLPKVQANVANGKIWQARNTDWVWESGLESQHQPIPVSGVYVNGIFHPTNTTGQYKHFVDYRQGRVVFDTPLPTGTVVEAEFSSRWVHIYNQDVTWFRDVIFDAYRYEVGNAAATNTSFVDLMKNNAIQLPAIVIESVANRRLVPLQLGDKSQIVYQDFLLHILAEYSADRSTLIDIITLQKDNTFYLYDVNAKAAANIGPLDLRGSKVPGAKTYPMLVELPPNGFRWKKCVFNKVVGQDTSSRLPLFRAIIRVTLEVDFTNP